MQIIDRRNIQRKKSLSSEEKPVSTIWLLSRKNWDRKNRGALASRRNRAEYGWARLKCIETMSNQKRGYNLQQDQILKAL